MAEEIKSTTAPEQANSEATETAVNFEPITSQEQLNRVIGARIRKAKESAEEKYSDYGTLKEKAEKYDKDIGDLRKTISTLKDEKSGLEDRINAYETASIKARIAREEGLPYELADRITGKDEEEMRADAQNLRKYMTPAARTAPPLRSTETENINPENREMKEFLKDLNARRK